MVGTWEARESGKRGKRGKSGSFPVFPSFPFPVGREGGKTLGNLDAVNRQRAAMQTTGGACLLCGKTTRNVGAWALPPDAAGSVRVYLYHYCGCHGHGQRAARLCELMIERHTARN